MDSDGCFWLGLPGGEVKTAIVPMAAGGVPEIYASFHEALATRAWRAGFSLGESHSSTPVFAGDGRIAYFQGKLQYFDGERWRSWQSSQIDPGLGFATGRASLLAHGRLAVQFDRLKAVRYEWDGSEWATLKLPSDADSQPPPEPATLPEGVPAGAVRAEGAEPFEPWYCVIKGRLTRVSHGVAKTVFADPRLDPFSTVIRPEAVVRDARGNHLVKMQNGGFVLAPIGTPPETQVRLAATEDDSVTMAFAAPGMEGARFFWRIDGGAWQGPLLRPHEVRVENLLPGPHRAEVVAMGFDLMPDPTPAGLSFETHFSPEDSVQRQVAALSSADPAVRQRAVRQLARFPALAAPALHLARVNSPDDDTRWWMDAALQEVERALTPRNTPAKVKP